jgi:hypothetical protein
MAGERRFNPVKGLKKEDRLLAKRKLPIDLTPHEEEYPVDDIPILPANIGARNPYVLARRRLELKNPEWKLSDHSPSGLKKMVVEALTESGLTYEQLFDPQFGSPLYQGLYEKTRNLVEFNPRLYGRLAEILNNKIKLPGDMPPDCKNLQKSTTQSSTIHGLNTQFNNTGANLKNAGLEFTDPVQGCVANCWLIAAFSSVAWAESYGSYSSSTRLARTTSMLGFYPPVYSTNTAGATVVSRPTKKPITTSPDFYLDQNGYPYYAHLNMHNLSQQYYEMWPSYYEKCYAGFMPQKTNSSFVAINDPNYAILNYGDPFEALSDITGRLYSADTTAYTRDYFGTNGALDNPDGIVERIRAKACGGTAFSPVANAVQFIKARSPAVAYTYFSESDVYSSANLSPYTSKVLYNCPGLPANHAFSILGVHQESCRKFVVLRNPWGTAGDTSSFNSTLQKSLATQLRTQVPFNSMTYVEQDGIFGLDSTTFMRYFKVFGWVP